MLRILEILAEGIILYLLYKFVVRFVIPVYRSTKRVRKQMKEMRDRMNDQMQSRQQQNSYSQYQHPAQAPPAQDKYREEEGEYIDYEEVK